MISILLPSRGRPEKLRTVITAIADTVAHPKKIEVIIRIDDDDPADYDFGMPKFCRLSTGPRPESKVAAYNAAYRLAKGDILMPLGDDSIFVSKSWDEIIKKEFADRPDGILLLYGQDGVQNEKLATHYIISRKMADALGYFSPPMFKGYFGDNFMMDLAQRIGRIKYNSKIAIDHQAAHVGKGKQDETFKSSIGLFQEDKKRYLSSGDEMKRAAAILSKLKAPDQEIHLAIGIPCNFQMVPLAFFESIMLMERPNFELVMKAIGHIDDMRNDIVKAAQEAGCTHLIMMDTDMIYHPQTITRLLSHHLPVVGAMTFRRYPPFDPLMLQKGEKKYRTVDTDGWEEGDLVEVDATGTGCLMFDMKVFEKMPFPWFKFRKNEDGSTIGEDIGFCQDLKAAGYRIFVDTAVPSSHLTTLAVDMQTHLLYKARARAIIRHSKRQGEQAA
jgi:hypothetical protein